MRGTDFNVFALIGGVLAGLPALAQDPTWSLQVEALVASQQRNRVQSPNNSTASRFSLDDITGDGPFIAPRIEAVFPWRERQEWRLLVAPLNVEERGTLQNAVRFQGVTFASGAVDARYQFNSYRIGWRWRWIERPDLTVRVGFTAKLRQAEIRLQQGATSARKTNTGFVPLAHASFERRSGEKWYWSGDIDALGGGPGYAIDAGLPVGRNWTPHWSTFVGARFLDGGADSDEVFAFARFASVTLGLRYRR